MRYPIFVFSLPFSTLRGISDAESPPSFVRKRLLEFTGIRLAKSTSISLAQTHRRSMVHTIFSPGSFEVTKHFSSENVKPPLRVAHLRKNRC